MLPKIITIIDLEIDFISLEEVRTNDSAKGNQIPRNRIGPQYCVTIQYNGVIEASNLDNKRKLANNRKHATEIPRRRITLSK